MKKGLAGTKLGVGRLGHSVVFKNGKREKGSFCSHDFKFCGRSWSTLNDCSPSGNEACFSPLILFFFAFLVQF